MWIDENGVTHTAWIPPESILDEEAVAALRTVPRATADDVIRELDVVARSVEEAATAAAGRGPSDLDQAELDTLPYPPTFPGLTPRAGEDLVTTVLRYLSVVSAEWRYEAMEAVYDVLEEPPTEET